MTREGNKEEIATCISTNLEDLIAGRVRIGHWLMKRGVQNKKKTKGVSERKETLKCVLIIIPKWASGYLALKVYIFSEIVILLYHLSSKSAKSLEYTLFQLWHFFNWLCYWPTMLQRSLPPKVKSKNYFWEHMGICLKKDINIWDRRTGKFLACCTIIQYLGPCLRLSVITNSWFSTCKFYIITYCGDFKRHCLFSLMKKNSNSVFVSPSFKSLRIVSYREFTRLVYGPLLMLLSNILNLEN